MGFSLTIGRKKPGRFPIIERPSHRRLRQDIAGDREIADDIIYRHHASSTLKISRLPPG
jgi:hypothetical protein